MRRVAIFGRFAAVVMAACLSFVAVRAQAGSEPKDSPPAPAHAEYTELAGYKKRVMIVLDRSGSMSISGRFERAEDEIERLAGALPHECSFDVLLFDRHADDLFDGESLRPTKDVKKKLRERLDAVGVNFQGFTDLCAGLAPAFDRHPQAVYLFTDGFPTAGETDPKRLVAAVKSMAHKVPLHVVAVLGGTYALGENLERPDAARSLLAELARSTGGKYREIEARATRPPVERPVAPGSDDVAIRCFGKGRSPILTKELDYPHFFVEVADPALVRGPVVLEYSPDIGISVRTRTRTGLIFDEVSNLPARYRNGVLETEEMVWFVGALDTQRRRDPSKGLLGRSPVVRMRAPAEGGMIEAVYTCGGKEHVRSFYFPGFQTDWPTPPSY